MKAKKKSYAEVVSGPFSIRPSDLKALGDLLRSDDNATIEVQNENDEFDNIDEFIAYKGFSRRLTLGRVPGLGAATVEVIIEPNSAQVRSFWGAPTQLDFGIASRVRDLLGRRVRHWRHVLLFLSVGAFFLVTTSFLPGLGKTARYVILIAGPIVVNGVYVRLSRRFVVLAPDDHERQTVDWATRRWELVKIIVTAVVGGIVGYVIRGKC